jgi:hypothetical protein
MTTHRLRLLALLLLSLPTIARAADAPADPAASATAVKALGEWLRLDADKRPPLGEQPFGAAPLTKADAATVRRMAWDDFAAHARTERAGEWRDRTLTLAGGTMRFDVRLFGDKPATGRALYLSLHGGGSAPKAVNDRQWENQKRLYKPDEGVYVAPRAPIDAWDMWHRPPVDALLERLITDAVLFEDVDPDRVFLTGYSAGGDGTYRLAPRLADRWAAAAMMAGHPGDITPLSLRNLPFAVHVGALDAAYERNKRAEEWGQKLAELHKQDPAGYEHEVVLHAGKGHWMDREDAAAIVWMGRHRRTPQPSKVVWEQEAVPRPSLYWLAAPANERHKGDRVTAEVRGSKVTVRADGPRSVVLRLADGLIDLDRPITVEVNGRKAFEGLVPRTAAVIVATTREREDPELAFPAEVTMAVPAEEKPR